MATKTQKEKIREYLEQGHSLTPIDALELFGCFRLATRIFELKKEGLNIETDMVENKATGKRYASYSIKTVPEGCVPPPVKLPSCPFGYYWGEEHETRAGCARCPELVYKKCKAASPGPVDDELF